LLAKVGAIALVGLMLLFVLMRIEGLVQERKGRGEEAVRGVEHSHAAAQAVRLVGPLHGGCGLCDAGAVAAAAGASG